MNHFPKIDEELIQRIDDQCDERLVQRTIDFDMNLWKMGMPMDEFKTLHEERNTK